MSLSDTADYGESRGQCQLDIAEGRFDCDPATWCVVVVRDAVQGRERSLGVMGAGVPVDPVSRRPLSMPVGVQACTSDTAPPIRDVLNGCDSVASVATENDRRPTRWTIRSERVVDETRRLRLSIASVELPDGVAFEQYVLRMPRAAMMVVLNGQRDVLMLWRHRFIIDRWVWELPGGYVDSDEDPASTAAREVEEETGWRPRIVTPLVSLQPSVGTTDSENLLFLAEGADYTGEPTDINEAQKVAWIPLASVRERIANGEIVGAASQVGLLHVLAFPPSERRGQP
jgi:8-oxo-dGTP pyrophosphatase MutT (NUDIX family)